MTSGPEYTLTDVIHQSASTTIYRGYRTRDRRPVAVKRLRNEHPTSTEVAKLHYEYAIAKELALPGVVTVYGVERVGGSLALIVEDPGGRPLNELIGSRELSLADALRIATSIAEALESIHRSGVIHMDVKPHNIIINTETMEAKLTDFGSATRLSQEALWSKGTVAFEGTPAYMSPEQTGRLSRIIDRRTDFYSFGVTLYELLTGVLPFRTSDLLELVHCHIAKPPPAPHEARPSVPRCVSDIVMKLMAKSPDERYQSAYGLKIDLDECLTRLAATGGVEPFPLGRHDHIDELRVPQRIYGRAVEVRALLDAWERARGGDASLVLISGYAGLGKSVLVTELNKDIARDRGHFVRGKFDQLDRTIPYVEVARVFKELVLDLLTESSEALAAWKRRIEEAVGANGQLVIDLIPELELVIGPQPATPQLGPTEAQNRFQLTFQNFCRAFPSKERPLAIFFDDLQWADPASLKLIQSLVAEARIPHLLVIGAYRESDGDAGQLFSLTVSELRKARGTVRELRLNPLAFQDANQLIADTLGEAPQRTEPLTRIVFDKTQGNPFFINQFMTALRSEKLLSFDPASLSWRWDLERIRDMKVTDNVVDFMARKIGRLAGRTQRILTLAACVGHEFDLTTLSIINRKPRAETARELWGALREGLVVPINPESRFFEVGTDGDMCAAGSDEIAGFEVSYKFLHDRVQQAAYSLIEEAEKRDVHLRIGRLFLAESGSDKRESLLFDTALHMNRGAALIRDPAERLALVQLNLDAGKRAKSGAAYESAARYLEHGISLAGQEGWERAYDLTFALHVELVECKYLTGQAAVAEEMFDTLASRSRTSLDRARVCNVRMGFYAMVGQLSNVITQGLAGLGHLGVQIPQAVAEREAYLKDEIAAMRASLAGRQVADLIDLPIVTDPQIQMIMKLIAELAVPALAADLLLGVIAVIKQINLSIAHGNSEASAHPYILYAMIVMSDPPQLRGIPDRYKEGYEFAKLGIGLHEKLNITRLTCRLLLAFVTIRHFFEPVRSVFDYLTRALHAGLGSGDLAFASYCCIHVVSTKLCLGEDLELLGEEIDQHLAFMGRTNEQNTICVLTCAKQVVANLKGQTAGRHTLGSESFDEGEFVKKIASPELVYVASWHHAFMLQLHYLHGDYEAAYPHVAKAESLSAGWSSHYWATDVPLFAGLTLAALYEAAPAPRREQYMIELLGQKDKLDRWVELCPANYAHKQLLVAAELARVSGRERDALALYDKAIDAAKENAFPRDEALASELCARLYAAQGWVRCARAYMTDAYQAYAAWGALAKTEDLDRTVPDLVPQAGVLPVRGAGAGAPHASGNQTTSTTRLNTSVLDVDAVIRAAQAIAGEVVLENVVNRLMDLAVKNAGAQKGALILERDGRMMVEATITVEPSAIQVGQAIPIEKSSELPMTIVQYVARTKEPLVLDDASQEPRFASDPYIAARSPKSVLCLAMIHQARAKGILYLEHGDAGTFTGGRIELLKLLLAQAATAVENALLFAHLEIRTMALKQTEDQLRVEFSERERSEQARIALQEEIIRVQNDRLAELSTPMIPITGRIMVMPLIGMMDRTRAQQVLHTALQGVAANKAQVVIIDITGVKMVDSDVAGTLISTATALQLLGAKAVITGIRPEVAQSLTGLQIDFGAIVTRGTLQSGIAYALRQTGRSKRSFRA